MRLNERLTLKMAFDEDDDERPKWIKDIVSKDNEGGLSPDQSPLKAKGTPLAAINSPSKLVALKL